MQLVVDSLRSAHNVGSILRTSDALGVTKVYLCGITPSPIDRFGRENQRVTKVALGAERSVAWESHPDTVELLRKLKKTGAFVVALEQTAQAVPLGELNLDAHQAARLVLVVGPEVTGLPNAVLDLADAVVEIPMRGTKESLNVAVAFGIAAYHLTGHSATQQQK